MQERSNYVHADGGLRMRTEPNTNAAMVILVPYAAEVFSIEKSEKEDNISGIYARWHKVSYTDNAGKDYTGWVFGGFIVTEKPGQLCNTLEKSPIKIFDQLEPAWGDTLDILLNSNGTGKISVGGHRLIIGDDTGEITWMLDGKKILFKKKPYKTTIENECRICVSMVTEECVKKEAECKKNFVSQTIEDTTDWEIKLIEPGKVHLDSYLNGQLVNERLHPYGNKKDLRCEN